jgi:uncharacterized protein (TIGR02996 family)
MVDGRDLCRAILAAPLDDPAPRLAFAEWLEARGDPSARAFRMKWPSPEATAALHEWVRPAIGRFRFRSYSEDRGILIMAHVPAAAFLELGDEILDTFPLLENVSIMLTDRAQPAALAACATVGRVRHLGFAAENKAARLGNKGLATFLASEHLGAVEGLGFERCDVGATGMTALAKAALPALAQLGVSNNPLGAKGIKPLTTSALRLGTLSLISAAIDDETLRLLAAWPGLRSVKVFRCWYHEDIGDDGIVALAASPHVAGLERLEVQGARFGNRGARAILESPHLAGLRHFTPGTRNTVDDASLKDALVRRFALQTM